MISSTLVLIPFILRTHSYLSLFFSSSVTLSNFMNCFIITFMCSVTCSFRSAHYPKQETERFRKEVLALREKNATKK